MPPVHTPAPLVVWAWDGPRRPRPWAPPSRDGRHRCRRPWPGPAAWHQPTAAAAAGWLVFRFARRPHRGRHPAAAAAAPRACRSHFVPRHGGAAVVCGRAPPQGAAKRGAPGGVVHGCTAGSRDPPRGDGGRAGRQFAPRPPRCWRDAPRLTARPAPAGAAVARPTAGRLGGGGPAPPARTASRPVCWQ